MKSLGWHVVLAFNRNFSLAFRPISKGRKIITHRLHYKQFLTKINVTPNLKSSLTQINVTILKSRLTQIEQTNKSNYDIRVDLEMTVYYLQNTTCYFTSEYKIEQHV
jgi:hypothetical protein